MKTSIRNRDQKIEIVSQIIDDLTSQRKMEEWDESMILSGVINKIVADKKLKGSRRNFVEDTKAFKRSFIDTYERALGSLLLFCFHSGIKTDIGYIYFISNPHYENCLKVGSTQDVETRLHQYQVCCPYRDFVIENYLICKNARSLERIALDYFQKDIICGEWVATNDKAISIKEFYKYLETEFELPSRFSCKTDYYKFLPL